MKNIRIIPRLDIKGQNLVKGIHLEGLRIMGKPEAFARHYYENGADELLYVDIVASLYGRNSILPIVEKVAREVFIPLTVAGGIRTIDDMKTMLRAGADKVAINTAAIKNPELIKQASKMFGSSTIVVSIEAIKRPDGRYLAYTDNGREYTGKEVVAWAQEAEELGAGEILLTSVDREGTGLGYDIELTRKVSESVSIPVIACGGAGSKQHVKEVISEGKADAVSFASILHYDYLEKHGDKDKKGFSLHLKMDRGFSKIEKSSLAEVKSYLAEEKIDCRH